MHMVISRQEPFQAPELVYTCGCVLGTLTFPVRPTLSEERHVQPINRKCDEDMAGTWIEMLPIFDSHVSLHQNLTDRYD